MKIRKCEGLIDLGLNAQEKVDVCVYVSVGAMHNCPWLNGGHPEPLGMVTVTTFSFSSISLSQHYEMKYYEILSLISF